MTSYSYTDILLWRSQPWSPSAAKDPWSVSGSGTEAVVVVRDLICLFVCVCVCVCLSKGNSRDNAVYGTRDSDFLVLRGF